jgi:cobalt-zinc-cadmium efflux system protein
MVKVHSEKGSGGRLFVTILINVVITAAEFIGGLITGYLALLADAVHNLSDVAALLLAYIGELGSRKAPTKTSTYGFKRVEVMTAFISAVALVVISVFIFYEAYRRVISPVVISNPGLLLIIASLGLIGNILSVFILRSTKDKTLNIKTAFLHMFYDALASMAVIIGAIVILKTGWSYIDPLLSAVIGLMIIWSSVDVLKEATMIFMEAVPRGIDYDEVKAAIRTHSKVCDVHDLHIWSLSSTSLALSCHIRLNQVDYDSAPEIINEVSRILDERFNIGHATIQCEREKCPSEEFIRHLRERR